MTEKLNKYLDNKFSEAMSESISDGFTDRMMDRIRVEREYTLKDKKTFRVINSLTVSFAVVIVAIGAAIYNIISRFSGDEITEQQGVLYNITESFNNLNAALFNSFGFTLSINLLIYVLLTFILAGIFLIAEKLVIRKRIN